jgi:hypothetical protein
MIVERTPAIGVSETADEANISEANISHFILEIIPVSIVRAAPETARGRSLLPKE